MHMDEGLLQAVVDDEVPPELRRNVERHLASCEECTWELHDLREAKFELSTALAQLDVPAPMLPARVRIRRAAQRRARPRGAAVARRAALFLIASAAALSATVPGSPVRGWLADAWHFAADRSERAPEPALASAETEVASAVAAPAGVSLVPVEGRARVVVSSPAAGLSIQIRMEETDRLGVWAWGAAANARFLTAADRVEVESPGPGELRIEIPHAADDVVVEVDGRTFLVKEGDRLRFPGPRAERSGPEIRFEVPR